MLKLLNRRSLVFTVFLSHVGLLLPVDRPGVPGEVEHLHSALRALLPHPLMNLLNVSSKVFYFLAALGTDTKLLFLPEGQNSISVRSHQQLQ